MFILEAFHESDKNRPHLNMYGKRPDGSLLLFTQAHILPKSLSGSNALFNMQIMCADCNSKKGNKVPKEDIPKILEQIKVGRASLLRIGKAHLRNTTINFLKYLKIRK